jgi:D-tyrosyl-tRNA(Tyr) deacylase
MRAIIQRVKYAQLQINQQLFSSINHGMMVLVGVTNTDTPEDIQWLSKKLVQLRIFDDQNGVMNLSINDTGGELMLVSQFTLHASTKKGNRPSYIKAAKPEVAIPLYNKLIATLEADLGKTIATGKFGADMQITLLNDGPVTIIIDTENKE